MMTACNLISLSTTVFGPETPEMPLEKMLDLIAEAGYPMVELSRKQHRLAARAEAIRRAGLRVWSIHGTLGEDAADRSEDRRRAAVAAEIPRLEDAAAFAPCPYVVHYHHRYHDPARGESFRRSIDELHRHAARLHLILAVETAPYKPRHNERYPDSAEIAAFVRSFAAPDLLMTVDINHSNLREDLEAVAVNCRDLIANVHISDNHGAWEDHLPPGRGVIDLAAAFAALRRNGYRGPCNLEFHADAAPDADYLRRVRERTAALLDW